MHSLVINPATKIIVSMIFYSDINNQTVFNILIFLNAWSNTGPAIIVL